MSAVVSFADLDAPDRATYPNLYRIHGLAKMHGLDTGFELRDWTSWRAQNVQWRIAVLTIGAGELEKNGWGIFGTRDPMDAYFRIQTQTAEGKKRRTSVTWYGRTCSMKSTLFDVEAKIPEWGMEL